MRDNNVRTEKFKVYGLAVEKYVGTVTYGHNCDFTDEPEVLNRVVVLAKNKDKYWDGLRRYVKITLEESFGECGSGWTTASWGHCDVEVFFKPVHYPFNYRPINEVLITLEYRDGRLEFPDRDEIEEDDVEAPIWWSFDGGDCYYPMGGVHVDMALFKKEARAFDERPVWIFTGASGLGKSTLGVHLDRMSVFETDMVTVLPDCITDDVIVLGNKGGFTVDDVKKKIFEPENAKVIVCNFAESSS